MPEIRGYYLFKNNNLKIKGFKGSIEDMAGPAIKSDHDKQPGQHERIDGSANKKKDKYDISAVFIIKNLLFQAEHY